MVTISTLTESVISGSVPFTVNANGKSNVSIPVSDAYEADIKMFILLKQIVGKS